MKKITQEVEIVGIDEQIEKATKLVALLKEANHQIKLMEGKVVIITTNNYYSNKD